MSHQSGWLHQILLNLDMIRYFMTELSELVPYLLLNCILVLYMLHWHQHSPSSSHTHYTMI